MSNKLYSLISDSGSVTNLEKKALATVIEHSMLENATNVTVAFSGGADSVALLHLLYMWKGVFGYTIKAVHLNHQLRGKEADCDESFCRDFCQRLNIPFVAKRLDIKAIAEEKSQSIELCAREQRYKLFEQNRDEGVVATAHTLSDSLETAIFNMARGTGLDGLIGIPPVRGYIIRPVVQVTRREIEEYCKVYNLDFVTDSTNLETEHTRNKIRNLVIPVLEDINPSLEEAYGRMSGILAEDASYLNQLAKNSLVSLQTDKGYLRKEFLLLEKPIANRVLREIISGLDDVEITENRINWLYEDIKDKKYNHQLSYKYRLIIKDDYFAIQPVKEYQNSFNVEFQLAPWELGQKVAVLQDKYLEISPLDCKEFANIENYYPERLKKLLDYDKMNTWLNLHQPLPRSAVAREGKRISTKRFYQKSGATAKTKQRLFVLSQDDKTLWIEGIGTDDSFKVDETTSRVVELRVYDKNNVLGEY